MKIYFVRHGETQYNKDGLNTGQIDAPLTEEGIEQARKVALEIPDNFSLIFSSDFIRCRQTTEIINEKINLPVIYDSRLRERNFGSLAGKTWQEIGLDLKELDKNQQYDYSIFGGESVEDVKNRLFSCINEIRNKKDDTILVITSGGIIRLLHNILNGEIHEKIHNSSIHEFEFPDK